MSIIYRESVENVGKSEFFVRYTKDEKWFKHSGIEDAFFAYPQIIINFFLNRKFTLFFTKIGSTSTPAINRYHNFTKQKTKKSISVLRFRRLLFSLSLRHLQFNSKPRLKISMCKLTLGFQSHPYPFHGIYSTFYW